MSSERHRLLIEEHELYEADRPRPAPDAVAPDAIAADAGIELPRRPALGRRLVYAETVPIDAALVAPPSPGAASTAL